jgi:hypothetical protein
MSMFFDHRKALPVPPSMQPIDYGVVAFYDQFRTFVALYLDSTHG